MRRQLSYDSLTRKTSLNDNKVLNCDASANTNAESWLIVAHNVFGLTNIQYVHVPEQLNSVNTTSAFCLLRDIVLGRSSSSLSVSVTVTFEPKFDTKGMTLTGLNCTLVTYYLNETTNKTIITGSSLKEKETFLNNHQKCVSFVLLKSRKEAHSFNTN